MDFPLQEGDTGVTVQLSPCVGGLLRTWSDDGNSSLWSVPDPDWLMSVQGIGQIGRTQRRDNSFREAAWLSEEGGVLIVQSRFPTEVGEDDLEIAAQVVQLEPATSPHDTAYRDFEELLLNAFRQAPANEEYFRVEKGGWDAPDEPYCMIALVAAGDDPNIAIQTSPAPVGSEVWEKHLVPGQDFQGIQMAASPETVDAVPVIMTHAISSWGLTPWDLALTFVSY